MADQWRSEKLPAGTGYSGDAVRERPVIAREGVGPWRGRVLVTHVQGAGWEVSCSWEGPPLEVAGRADAHHLIVAGDTTATPAPATLSHDVHYVASEQLARAIAETATRALRTPQRPNLGAIARDLTGRRS